MFGWFKKSDTPVVQIVAKQTMETPEKTLDVKAEPTYYVFKADLHDDAKTVITTSFLDSKGDEQLPPAYFLLQVKLFMNNLGYNIKDIQFTEYDV